MASTIACSPQSNGSVNLIINIDSASPQNWGVTVTSSVDWGKGVGGLSECQYMVENFFGTGSQTINKNYISRPGNYCAVLAPITISGGESVCTFTVGGGGLGQSQSSMYIYAAAIGFFVLMMMRK